MSTFVRLLTSCFTGDRISLKEPQCNGVMTEYTGFVTEVEALFPTCKVSSAWRRMISETDVSPSRSTRKK